MKTIATPSFFKSLKNINSLKSKYYHVRSWIKYHFNKDNFNIIKTVLKTYPWDYAYLYKLEKVKIQEMINYHKKHQRFEGWENVVRNMETCCKLIDIVLGETKTFEYTGDVKYIPIENSDNVEINTDSLSYHCMVNVNMKNVDRFCNNEFEKKCFLEHPHELYIRKAKYLYHKIRFENDETWWD